jgi:phenylalanyl-tRNA synthetase beta chain
MKLSPQWLRDFVDLAVANRRLADDLTLAGIAVEGISGSGDGAIFEMEITTNRPDAMNHYGVARECSALYNLPLKPLEARLPKSDGKANFVISVEDKEGCARYTARIIRGVSIKDSPPSIASRLASVDQRAINNAADASNYTLWEMGHPTHAFDLDLLEGGKIVVRKAQPGESLKTLDGVERKLFPEDLIIADANKPVALAGVMGGFDTMITSKTKNVLIESAWFDPTTVRKTAKRHGMHTDASHRFERGADFGATSLACGLVAQRMLESGGGQLEGGEIDVIAGELEQAPIALSVTEVYRILGEELPRQEIYRVLDKLGFELMPERGGDFDFTVRIPSWRLDVEREIDLIEEIARLHGYDKFANTLPSFAGGVVEQSDAKKDESLRSTALALGYNEAISLTFISHEDAERFSNLPVIELANPLSAEASVMRTSMLPGMLNMLAYNLNRDSKNVRLFEAGSVFELAEGKSRELKRVCLGATGSAVVPGVHQPARRFSIFDLKGDVERLLHAFQFNSLHYDNQAPEYFHSGRCGRAVMNGVTVAEFGQMDPGVAEARKLRQDVFAAEIFLDRLYQFDLRRVRYQALPRYPAVERDFSFVFADSVAFDKIEQAVLALGVAELRSFAPVEVFRGGSVAAGSYSILLRATFQSNDRTLREDEVAEWSGKIIRRLEAMGGTLRA